MANAVRALILVRPPSLLLRSARNESLALQGRGVAYGMGASIRQPRPVSALEPMPLF